MKGREGKGREGKGREMCKEGEMCKEEGTKRKEEESVGFDPLMSKVSSSLNTPMI